MNPEEKEINLAIIKAMDLPAAAGITREELRNVMAAYINELIIQKFDYLVSLLYRMDISENKLKLLLASYPGADAGLVIADLVIERQAQKIKSREQYRSRDNDISEEERW
jgi:hypothetical protein